MYSHQQPPSRFPRRDLAQKGGSVSGHRALKQLDERGAATVIQPKSHRKQKRDYGIDALQSRQLVKNWLA